MMNVNEYLSNPLGSQHNCWLKSAYLTPTWWFFFHCQIKSRMVYEGVINISISKLGPKRMAFLPRGQQCKYQHQLTHALAQDCSNSITKSVELLQSCTKPSISYFASPRVGVIKPIFLHSVILPVFRIYKDTGNLLNLTFIFNKLSFSPAKLNFLEKKATFAFEFLTCLFQTIQTAISQLLFTWWRHQMETFSA